MKKRYVKEFANDELKNPYNEVTKQRIQNIVKHYDKGMITDFEAVKSIVQAVDMHDEVIR